MAPLALAGGQQPKSLSLGLPGRPSLPLVREAAWMGLHGQAAPESNGPCHQATDVHGLLAMVPQPACPHGPLLGVADPYSLKATLYCTALKSNFGPRVCLGW
jgi:hypothetical protein